MENQECFLQTKKLLNDKYGSIEILLYRFKEHRKIERRNPLPYDIKFDFCNEGVLFTKKSWLATEDNKGLYKRSEGTKEHEIQASNY